MGDHDPYVEDFRWSMDDNRHTESKSPELTEGDVPKLLLFADREVIRRVRTQASSSTEPDVRRDVRGSRAFAAMLRPRSSVTDKVSRSMS